VEAVAIDWVRVILRFRGKSHRPVSDGRPQVLMKQDLRFVDQVRYLTTDYVKVGMDVGLKFWVAASKSRKVWSLHLRDRGHNYSVFQRVRT
jgi:hypothetical protein